MIKVFFDGSCIPNPGGVISYGAVIKQHEKIIYEISKKINIPSINSTNNVAEYCACIAALKYLIFKSLNTYEIYVFGDSKLVINQMAGIWEIGEGKYTKYADIAKDLLFQFSNIHFEWISRERNHHADSLARKAYGI
jgi:ribonuclease HI